MSATDQLDTAKLLAGAARRRYCLCLPHNMGVGLVIVCVMAAAQTSSSELTGAGLASLQAPFFTMWLHTAFMIFLLPITLALQAIGLSAGEHNMRNLHSDLWEGLAPGRSSGRVPPLVWKAAGFYVLWVAANYAYAVGLVFASAGLVVAVFSSCSAFVALLSRLWLKEQMTVGKLGSVVLAVSGVLVLGVTTHSAAQGTNPALGVLFALLSSISAAVYKVAFKAVFPAELSMRKLSVFLSLIGLINLVAGTLPCFLLGYYAVEEPVWAPSPPISSNGPRPPERAATWSFLSVPTRSRAWVGDRLV